MIKEFVEKWWKYKDDLEAYFRNIENINSITYESIAAALIKNIINKGVANVGFPEDFSVIDDGHYQGMQIFIFHNDIYQPGIVNYFFADNYYGSCSGCDTLLSIVYGNRRRANEEEIKELMQLAFDLLRNIKPFDDNAEFDWGFIHLTEEDGQ